jgi:hypothetical protein
MPDRAIVAPPELHGISMNPDFAAQCGGKRFGRTTLVSSSRRPLFTVVTAVFNGADSLESTILSVLSQDYLDAEHIIIDGGSQDGTLDILRKYENSIDYWVSEPDKGVYDAFNKACRLLTGEWTIFLGAGDLFYDVNVLTSMEEVVSHVGFETEMVYGKVCLTNNSKMPVETFNSPWAQMSRRWLAGRPMLPHHQGVFHRNRILSAATPFDTRYKIAADSKLLYSSIQRAQPIFSNMVVTSASIGGVSTAVKHSMTAANEVVQINREFGFTNRPHQFWFYSKAVMKTAIDKLGGETVSALCVDAYRRLTGRERLRDKSNTAI